MKSVLVGAVESTQVALETMCISGFSPALVVTLPPDLAQNHSDFVDIVPLAVSNNIDVFFAAKTNDSSTFGAIEAISPEVIFVIGWSQLCNEKFRNLAKQGCIGYHPSALPKLRGRAVIPWTILLGESRSAASLFVLAEGADTGDIVAQTFFDIDPQRETARSLYDKQMSALAAMLPDVLKSLANGNAMRTRQDATQATYCAKRVADDGLIDWNQSAAKIERLVRAAGPPYPGAFSFANGKRITILESNVLPGPSPYIGIVGQVQSRSDREFIVLCGDYRCLKITQWDGLRKAPRNHIRLGPT